MENKIKAPIQWEETEQAGRGLVSWLNGWTDFPVGVLSVNYNHLSTDDVGMAVSPIQGGKIKQYIMGGYLAEYQFKLIYRVHPTDNDDRLKATEVLDRFGAWAEQNPEKPNLGDRAKVLEVKRDDCATLFAPYQDGSEDYQILMTMTWEVM